MIDYTERQHAIEKMYEHIIKRLEKAIKKHQRQSHNYDGLFTSDYTTDFLIKHLTKCLKEYKSQVVDLQNDYVNYNFALYDRKIPLILVFEGMDAAGKGEISKELEKS